MNDEATPELHPGDTIRRAPGLSSVELDGETVLYDPERDQVHLLDAVATVVWSQLDGTEPLGRLCERLADAFNAPADRVASDVFALVSNLTEQGIIERVDDTGGGRPRN